MRTVEPDRVIYQSFIKFKAFAPSAGAHGAWRSKFGRENIM